jgi:hypothetical protein
MQFQCCLFFGNTVAMIHVHGHYQCPVCKTNALPCCEGDNCEPNNLLQLDYLVTGADKEKILRSKLINPSHRITSSFQQRVIIHGVLPFFPKHYTIGNVLCQLGFSLSGVLSVIINFKRCGSSNGGYHS